MIEAHRRVRRAVLSCSAAALALAVVSTPALAGPLQPSASAADVESAETTSTGTAPGPLRHLVVGAFGSPGISVLGTTREGELSSVPGSPYATGPLSLALAITPDARKVYSAHTATGTIVGYSIAPDGSLHQIEGGTVVASGAVSGLAITPDGSRAFATVNGEVRSYSISPSGVLEPTGAAPGQTGALSAISQVAIAPDARHLVVTNYLSNSVTAFAIGPNSELTRVGSPVPTGDKPVMPAFTPDGRHLYVSNESSSSVSGYALQSDGKLTPTPGSPYRTPSTPHGAAITPDGERLYVPSSGVDATGDNSVAGFRIGADGALTEQLPGSPYQVEGAVGRVALSPDGRRMFVVEGVGDVIGAPAPPSLPLAQDEPSTKDETDGSSDPLLSEVHSYTVRPDGSLTTSGFPSISTGLLWSDGSTAFTTPNQGPVARLRVAEQDGSTVTFSADDSTDTDGNITHYHWDFGDGQQLTTTTPHATHQYDDNDPHTTTLTVTDDENCSTQLIYTGTTATCTGSRSEERREGKSVR